VNSGLRLVAALAAVILPINDSRASGSTTPVIQFDKEPPVATGIPTVTFAVPKYSLTKTEAETVATCLVLEAANQGEFGLRSVMAVIRNRAHGRPELFAATVLREKQFSALNKLTAGRETLSRTVARAANDRMWPIALAIVDEATHETWLDPTNGATYYARTGDRIRWTSRLTPTVNIGAHSFYR
jgi:hypothetical protein